MKALFCTVGIFAVLVFLAGCEKNTDFVAGQVYRVKKPVVIWKYDKTDDRSEAPALTRYKPLRSGKDKANSSVENVAEFREDFANNPHVIGILQPEDQIRVTKFVKRRTAFVDGWGSYLRAYAVVLTGERKGTVVSIQEISRGGPGAKPLLSLDPEYLEIVK